MGRFSQYGSLCRPSRIVYQSNVIVSRFGGQRDGHYQKYGQQLCKPYHVGYLIVVCILKCCFSLKDISKMINIYRNMKDDHIELHYNRFISIFEKNLKEIFLSNTLPNLTYESPSPEQQLMESAIRTVVYKIYSQSLLHSMSE